MSDGVSKSAGKIDDSIPQQSIDRADVKAKGATDRFEFGSKTVVDLVSTPDLLVSKVDEEKFYADMDALPELKIEGLIVATGDNTPLLTNVRESILAEFDKFKSDRLNPLSEVFYKKDANIFNKIDALKKYKNLVDLEFIAFKRKAEDLLEEVSVIESQMSNFDLISRDKLTDLPVTSALMDEKVTYFSDKISTGENAIGLIEEWKEFQNELLINYIAEKNEGLTLDSVKTLLNKTSGAGESVEFSETEMQEITTINSFIDNPENGISDKVELVAVGEADAGQFSKKMPTEEMRKLANDFMTAYNQSSGLGFEEFAPYVSDIFVLAIAGPEKYWENSANHEAWAAYHGNALLAFKRANDLAKSAGIENPHYRLSISSEKGSEHRRSGIKLRVKSAEEKIQSDVTGELKLNENNLLYEEFSTLEDVKAKLIEDPNNPDAINYLIKMASIAANTSNENKAYVESLVSSDAVTDMTKAILIAAYGLENPVVEYVFDEFIADQVSKGEKWEEYTYKKKDLLTEKVWDDELKDVRSSKWADKDDGDYFGESTIDLEKIEREKYNDNEDTEFHKKTLLYLKTVRSDHPEDYARYMRVHMLDKDKESNENYLVKYISEKLLSDDVTHESKVLLVYELLRFKPDVPLDGLNIQIIIEGLNEYVKVVPDRKERFYSKIIDAYKENKVRIPLSVLEWQFRKDPNSIYDLLTDDKRLGFSDPKKGSVIGDYKDCATFYMKNLHALVQEKERGGIYNDFNARRMYITQNNSSNSMDYDKMSVDDIKSFKQRAIIKNLGIDLWDIKNAA